MKNQIERAEPEFAFTSRYDVFGPPNGCKGDCEGTGVVPVKADDPDKLTRFQWMLAEAKHATDDGWHFVPCPDCHPKGKEAREWLKRIE